MARKRNDDGGGPVESSPPLPADPLARARLLHQNGLLEPAREAYEQAWQADRSDPRPLRGLGQLRAQLGDWKGAAKLLGRAVELAPSNVGTRNNLGNALRAAGDLEGAVAAYREAIGLDPGEADSHFNLAVALTEAGRIGEAVAELEETVRIAPRHPRAHVALGDLAAAAGKLDEAIAAYRRGLAVDPRSFAALVSIGAAFYRQGNLRKAREALLAATLVDPRSATALGRLGVVLYETGELEVALRCERDAARLEPENPDHRTNLGFLLGEAGRSDEAIETLRQVVEEHPESIPARSRLAELFAKLRRPDEAERLCREIVRLSPDSAEARTSLGIALREKGEFAAAVAELEKARELAPSGARATAHLGLALQEDGRRDESDQLFEYPDLVARFPFESVDGWGSTAAFNAALSDFVRSHPTLLRDRPGKPVHGGRQTHEIFLDDAPVMAALRREIDARIRQYLAGPAAAARSPYFGRTPASWHLSGWGVVLEPEGFQDSHIHPESFVSGVYYVSIPDSVRASDSGRGALSFHGLFPGDADDSRFRIRPEEGTLVVFPSYFWHRTIPFDGPGDRVCISFNTIVG